MLLDAEDAHRFGLDGPSQTDARRAGTRIIAGLLADHEAFVAQIARRALQQAMSEAMPLYWLRRAEQLEWAGTPSADEAAGNCRRHAWLLTTISATADQLSDLDWEVAA